MPRHAPRPLERLTALLPLVAATAALAGAAWALLLSLGLEHLASVSVPVLGPAGGLALAIDPARAGVLAAMLIVGVACLLAASSVPASLILLVAGSAAVLENNQYTIVFATLIVLVVARHARAAEPVTLAVLPAVLLTVAEVIGLNAIWIVVGATGLVAAGIWAAVTLDLAKLARAVALGFAAIALIAFGLGDAAAMRLALETGALTAPVIALGASVIDEATGTRSPDWLGGLARGMPRFSLLLCGALFFASLLPPGPGFAAFRMSFGAALGAAGWPGGLAALALGLGFALSVFAAIRAFGLICLGRPRSLRAAAAEDAPRRILLALGLPVVCGMALALRMEPFALFVPLAILLVLYRITSRTGPIEAPPFEDGFARPPAWLPFGDPATQVNATGFAAPLHDLAALLPISLRDRLRL